MEYSEELKETVLRKALGRESTQEALAEEFGIGRSTVQKWLCEYRRSGAESMSKGERRPQDWGAEERMDALIETGALSADEVGVWCRRHGLHTHHLERWRRELIEGQGLGKESQAVMRSLREANRALNKELRRKDKALAETTALLVLKKKATSIWGEAEDD